MLFVGSMDVKTKKEAEETLLSGCGDPGSCSVPAEIANTPSSSLKLVYGLMFYAGAVTAALVTVSVFSALYHWNQENTKNALNTGKEWKNVYHYTTEYQGVKEDLDLDMNNDKVMIQQFETNGNITLAVFDFKTGIGGIYDAGHNFCLMMDDLGDLGENTESLKRFLDSHESRHEGISSQKVKYEIIREIPVDLSNLPSDLIKPCWGKQVFNVTKVKDNDGSRQKRFIHFLFIALDLFEIFLI